MPFDDKILLERLALLFSLNKLPHALLLCGPEGSGKRTFARSLTAQIFASCATEEKKNLEKMLQRIEEGNHPDFISISPEGPLAQHPIDAIRSIQEQANLHPFEAPLKVFFIPAAERLPKASCNALLKVIEEPPQKTLMLLISNHPERILPTILSRCQRLSFAALPHSAIVEFLCQKTDTPHDQAECIAQQARGSLAQALFLRQKGGEKPLADLLFAILQQRQKMPYHDLVDRVEELCSFLEAEKSGLVKEAHLQHQKLHESEGLNKLTKHHIERREEADGALFLSERVLELFELATSWFRDMHYLCYGGQKSKLWNVSYADAIEQAVQKGRLISMERVLKAVDDARLSLQRSTALNRVVERLLLELLY